MQQNPQSPQPIDTPPSLKFTVANLVRQAGVDAWGVAKSIWWAISLPWIVFAAGVYTAGEQIGADASLREAKNAVEDFSEKTAGGASEAEIEELFSTLSGIDYSDLIVKIVAWTVPIVLAYLLAVAYTTALVGIELRRLRGENGGGRGDSLKTALGRTPAMVLAYVYCYILPFAAVGVAVLGGFFFAGAGGAVLLAILGAIAVVWWIVRNSLIGVAVGTRTGFAKPVREANRAVRGRWWAVSGRLLIVSVAVSIAGMLISGIVEIGSVGGAEGMLALWVAARLLSSLVGTTYAVAFQLSMLEALEAEKAGL